MSSLPLADCVVETTELWQMLSIISCLSEYSSLKAHTANSVLFLDQALTLTRSKYAEGVARRMRVDIDRGGSVLFDT